MNKLQNLIFTYYEKQVSKHIVRNKMFVSYDKIQRILLLYESDLMEKNQEINQIANQLRQDKKRVTTYGFVSKNEILTPILPNACIFGKKQINCFGKPIEIINGLSEAEFDVIIDLTINECLPLQYILLYANASCKIGMQHNAHHLLDFVIQYPTTTTTNEETEGNTADELTPQQLYEQIGFYLKCIRSND